MEAHASLGSLTRRSAGVAGSDLTGLGWASDLATHGARPRRQGMEGRYDQRVELR